MKNVFFYILAVIIFNKTSAQYNSGLIVYNKDYYKTFSELNSKLKKNDPERFSEYNKIWENSRSIVRDLKFILTFNGNESLFKVKNFVNNDIAPFEVEFALGVTGASIYYKNTFNKIYYRKTDAFGETFLIEMPDPEWILTNNTKTINGFNCLRANAQTVTLGRKGKIRRDVIAWYCPDLPIPFGPIGFGGLPGLIIQLIYDNEVYTVQKIDLNPREQIKIKKPSKGIKVSKIEFEKIGLNKIKDYRTMAN